MAATGSTWAWANESRPVGNWQSLPLLPAASSGRAVMSLVAWHRGSGWFVETMIAVMPPILLNISQDGSNVVLNWTGGQGPYQVQQTSQLGSSNFWQNSGPAVTTNSMSLPLGSGTLFLRVRGQ